MALHNRRYYRIQRQKHINRKKSTSIEKKELLKNRIIIGTMNMKVFLIKEKFIAVVECAEAKLIIKVNTV